MLKVILCELNSFLMSTLPLGLCYIFCVQKCFPAKWKVHISKAALVLVEENRVHNTQSNYSFLFLRNVTHISLRHICSFLKMPLTLTPNISATVHRSCLNTRKSAILYNTRKNTDENGDDVIRPWIIVLGDQIGVLTRKLQLPLTKFAKSFVIFNRWRQKCSPLQIIEPLTWKWRQKWRPLQIIDPLTEKTWGRYCVIQKRVKWLRVGLQVWAKKIFWMNNKAIIEFGFRGIWRILPSASVNNTLLLTTAFSPLRYTCYPCCWYRTGLNVKRSVFSRWTT